MIFVSHVVIPLWNLISAFNLSNMILLNNLKRETPPVPVGRLKPETSLNNLKPETPPVPIGQAET